MKKIMIAALGLSLLPVSAVFAQNTSSSSTTSTEGSTKTKKSKKHKKVLLTP